MTVSIRVYYTVLVVKIETRMPHPKKLSLKDPDPGSFFPPRAGIGNGKKSDPR
jgi:hypothetical protein